MDTSISRIARKAPEAMFALAAAVEDWPRLLPHYRWVRILASDGQHIRTVEMAARRDVIGSLGVPLRWTAIETLYPESTKIEFVHIRGITRGMHVTWTIERCVDEPSSVLVQIRHVFEPGWPVPAAFVNAVVGDYFVNGVARRTLAYLAT